MADSNAAKLEQLRESVEQDQQELRRAVDELTTAAQTKFVFGDRLAEQALPALGGMFLLGLWLGHRSPRSR